MIISKTARAAPYQSSPTLTGSVRTIEHSMVRTNCHAEINTVTPTVTHLPASREASPQLSPISRLLERRLPSCHPSPCFWRGVSPAVTHLPASGEASPGCHPLPASGEASHQLSPISLLLERRLQAVTLSRLLERRLTSCPIYPCFWRGVSKLSPISLLLEKRLLYNNNKKKKNNERISRAPSHVKHAQLR